MRCWCLSIVMLVACNHAPAPSPQPDPVPAPAPAPPVQAPTPTPVGSDAAPKGCTSDADCTLHASYCNETPCACLALGPGEAAPTCDSKVKCFVDPCRNKRAACTDGKCIAVAN